MRTDAVNIMDALDGEQTMPGPVSLTWFNAFIHEPKEMSGMKTRVLLVDDHQLMREALRSILEKERNVEVVGEAADGEQAVLETTRLRPDVVLMDVAMRDLNGIEATRRIRASAPGTRVLALSSYADRRYVNAMLRAGACGYVLKANAFEELVVNDIPLGVEQSWSFHEMCRQDWPSNGILLIGTDGVWEAENEDGKTFGRQGMLETLRATAHLPAAEICDAFGARLREFRGAKPQRDDVTLVVVKFT